MQLDAQEKDKHIIVCGIEACPLFWLFFIKELINKESNIKSQSET